MILEGVLSKVIQSGEYRREEKNLGFFFAPRLGILHAEWGITKFSPSNPYPSPNPVSPMHAHFSLSHSEHLRKDRFRGLISFVHDHKSRRIYLASVPAPALQPTVNKQINK